MKRLIAIVAVLALTSAAWGEGSVAPAAPAGESAKKARPTIEVAFVVDTTGSMSGLIAGAKAKIWQIANQLVSGEPRPLVRMALVPYRDKGDEYVTKVFDLTDNIDQVYKDLMDFQANGGGDGPENVNQALFDAVNKLAWSKDAGTMKIIFLVGDYPAHNEYADVPTYDKLAKAAIAKGIYINTVLCGGNAEARRVWTEIALAAEGRFMAIDQGGGVQVVSTPFDKELGELNSALSRTVVAYGEKREQEKTLALAGTAADLPAAPGAERAAYAAKSGKSVGGGDLVDKINSGEVKLKDVADDKLPEPMQKMTPEERERFVKERQVEREKLNKQIVELAGRRDAYIAKELATNAKDATKGFDYQVIVTLQKQAEKFGIRYEAPAAPTTRPDAK